MSADGGSFLPWGSCFQKSPSGRIEYVLEQLPLGRLKVLDVGNVGGDASPHARLRGVVEERGGRLVGVDLEKPPGAPLSQVVGNALRLPFVDGSFDAVYMGEVIEHVWNPRASLLEVHRVLRPEGTLILDTPHVYAFGRLVAWTLLGRDSMGDSDHKLLLTPAAMANLLEKAGFRVLDMCTDAKWAVGGRSLRWVPWGRRLGSHLLATAKKS